MARLVSAIGSLSFAVIAGVSFASAPDASAQAVGSKAATSMLPILAGTPTETRDPQAKVQRWACADGLEIDVKPVSYDGGKPAKASAKTPEEWVIIYRENGKAVSSERVSREQAMRTPTWSCRPSTTS